MRIGLKAGLAPCDLTYCTNIHPGETWPDIDTALRTYLPRVKSLVAVKQPFGVGLRMSATALPALLDDEATLTAFRGFLRDNGLYVFTINGFPYGNFHGSRVKESVYHPDWRHPARLAYTDGLARLLAALLAGEPEEIEGSISTVPGGFAPDIRSDGDRAEIAAAILRHAATLVELHRRCGRVITLAIEPEPCCLLDTAASTIAFFRDHLFSPASIRDFGGVTGLSKAAAEEGLRRHIGICLDACHMAVEFDEPIAAVASFTGAGIRIAKLQASAGLRLPEATPEARAALAAFADDIYLHQVVTRDRAGRMRRFIDLDQALAAPSRDDEEWRVHFHVPVFAEDMLAGHRGTFTTTSAELAALLQRQRQQPFTRHVEIETYTWDVVPATLRGSDIVHDIAREITWVLRHLGHPLSAPR
ncbi:metabolite traffic protein EboE [Telmatospirillum siberiense]|uniref:Sugar phosphate isomerase n=1 Tax=Telmatospirillum siberiense TaxID=382514 RepID=A0A2N3PZR5_9PROT|nr:metabolite traffic protein EboE [Telmatospirillum siberiense]PKU25907.1 sugar phosphate isomerase [Telmatospirillum siberiense]